MDFIQLMTVLIIVGICGSIAAWIVGYAPGGLLLSMIVGVIGAYLGGWFNSLLPFQIPLLSRLDIEVGTTRFNLIWAIIGSVVLLLLLNALRRGERRPIFSWRR